MDKRKSGTRRRGEILETAILQAAWEELAITGYKDMTMESVATRAGTNKAVLYRRWGNKTELVIATVRAHLPKITNEVPNTGNLRDDVYTYLHSRIEPIKIVGTQTIRGLLMEPVVWHMIIASRLELLEQGTEVENKISTAMVEILKNAELRGEINFEKLTPRIISLPLDLLLYELITKLEPASDEAIAEIVDGVFMPLIRAQAGR